MESPIHGQLSTVLLLKQWYVACEAKDLGASKPLAVTLLDTHMVLFRDNDGKACALPDRCPHRNVPLSEGNVINGELVCIYHGWQFNNRGERTVVPGLLEQESHRCSVPTFSCMEQDGFVWVCPSPGHRPVTQPLPLPTVGAGYTSYRFVFDLDCTVHAALENALDVAHTSFLHGGLFRGVQARNPVIVDLKPITQGFEAEYLGEPLLPGGRKPPKGVKPQHWDRFFLPSTVQIEYFAGEANHVINTMYHTPVSAMKTRLYFVGYMRLPGLGRFFKPLIAYNVKKVLQQDIDILAKQTANILRFDGEHYKSSQMDLFGPQVLRFMRHAASFEKGEVDTPVPEYQPRQFKITL